MNTQKKLAYRTYLAQFVTKERQKKIKEVLALRTRHITVALEDVCNSQNVAAIMRTCEAMGLQEMYAIEMEKSAIDVKTNVARGAIQWMQLSRFRMKDYENPSLACIKKLKEEGYKVIATSPHATTMLSELPIDHKIAFLFGTENDGLTEAALQAADDCIALPQYGFVESLNVAVSAALCLYDAVGRLRASSTPWGLSEQEAFDLEIAWMERSLDRPVLMRELFFAQYKE